MAEESSRPHGRGRVLVPQEPEAATRAKVPEGAARDVGMDDGDTALGPNGTEDSFGPGGGEGPGGAEQGDSEPGKGGGLGLPVVEVRGEEEGRAAAVFTPKSVQMNLGARRNAWE